MTGHDPDSGTQTFEGVAGKPTIPSGSGQDQRVKLGREYGRNLTPYSTNPSPAKHLRTRVSNLSINRSFTPPGAGWTHANRDLAQSGQLGLREWSCPRL